MKYFFTFSILFITFSSIVAQNWQTKVDERLLPYQSSTEQIEFLIQFVEQGDVSQSKFLVDKTAKGTLVMEKLQQQTVASQTKVVNILDDKKVAYQSFWVANVIWVHGDFELIKTIAKHPEVLRISENSKMKIIEPEIITETTLQKNIEIQWGILNMQVDKVWEKGYKGQGVVIGGQDTGYDWEHESLKAKYRGWDGIVANHNYNWHDAIRNYDDKHDTESNPCGLDTDVPCDDNRHGTHTMGTMVGETEELKIGVAPEARWIGCRNMERGWGTPQTYLECFQWFLAPTDLNGENPDPSKAPHVIANSWGCPEIEGCNPNNFGIMEMAVNNLKAAGVVVVVSAGNSGPSCETVSTPAAIYENSFTVGAISSNDTVANFSSRGIVTVDGSNRLKPNIAAPGVGIKSSIPGNSYASFSGTSMAGPHVAGLVALLISADPTLAGDVERIETLIEQTAKPMQSTQDCGIYEGTSIPNAVYGFGNVNALAAVNEALATLDNATNLQLTIYPNPVIDAFDIQYVGYEGQATLEFFAADGKLVRVERLNFAGGNKIRNVNISNFTDGVYFYRFCDDLDCTEGRIVKVK